MAESLEALRAKRPRFSTQGEGVVREEEKEEKGNGGSGKASGSFEAKEEKEGKRDVYYLANFKSILFTVVLSRDKGVYEGHVISETSRAIVDKFMALPGECKERGQLEILWQFYHHCILVLSLSLHLPPPRFRAAATAVCSSVSPQAPVVACKQASLPCHCSRPCSTSCWTDYSWFPRRW